MASAEDQALGIVRGYTQGVPAGDAPDPLLQFFAYEHLPPQLAAISMLFWELAHNLVVQTPRNPERTVALRKLLESKDCAVRAVLYKP